MNSVPSKVKLEKVLFNKGFVQENVKYMKNSCDLTHFRSMFPFYTPRKHRKPFLGVIKQGYFCFFLGVIKREH